MSGLFYKVPRFSNVLARYSYRPTTITSKTFLSAQLFSSSATAKMSSPDITLYTAQTPNGIKISIALEELG